LIALVQPKITATNGVVVSEKIVCPHPDLSKEGSGPEGWFLLSTQGRRNDVQDLLHHSTSLCIMLVYSTYSPDCQTTQ
jgi:hypothetical protein